MKKEELEKLLQKYYSGESTVEEERALSVFFNSDNVPGGYETEKAIFSYYMSSLQVPEPSSDLEERIISGIDQAQKKSGKFRKYILPSLSVAAGILIIAGTWFFISRQDDLQDTFTDPQIAYAETMKILLGVSNKMNKAERALQPVSVMTELPLKSLETLSRSGRIIEKSLENLSSIHEVINNTNLPVRDSNKNN